MGATRASASLGRQRQTERDGLVAHEVDKLRRENNALVREYASETLVIEPWGKDSLRVPQDDELIPR